MVRSVPVEYKLHKKFIFCHFCSRMSPKGLDQHSTTGRRAIDVSWLNWRWSCDYIVHSSQSSPNVLTTQLKTFFSFFLKKTLKSWWNVHHLGVAFALKTHSGLWLSPASFVTVNKPQASWSNEIPGNAKPRSWPWTTGDLCVEKGRGDVEKQTVVYGRHPGEFGGEGHSGGCGLGWFTWLWYRRVGTEQQHGGDETLISKVIGVLKEWLNQMTLQMKKVKTGFRVWSSYHK